MIDALILNYNDSESTLETIHYLEKYDVINKIIVVDNCSSDNSLNEIRECHKEKVKVIKTEWNGGYGMGNNFGMEYLKVNGDSKYVLLANPDTYVTENCLKKLLFFLENNDEYAIVAPFMCDKNGAKVNTTAFRIPEKKEYIRSLDIFSTKFSSTFYYPSILEDNSSSKEVGAVAGSLFLMSKEKMMRTGLFDENIFLYCEEVVLGIKLQKYKYKTALLCNEVFIHNHSVSINKAFSSPIKKRKILNKSKLYVIKKYYNASRSEMLLANIFAKVSIMQLFLIVTIKKVMRG